MSTQWNVSNPRPKTHIATQIWHVGPYSFMMAVPKIGTPDDLPIYFAYAQGYVARSESFDTLEEAMRYVTRPTRKDVREGRNFID